MKTLDEALDEHCKQVFNEKKSSEFVNQAQISFTKGSLFGFESGVKHTKEEYEEKLRWIPVEEKLPEKQGHYLVIAPKSFPKNCKVVVAEFYEDNNTFYSENSDCPIEDATNWRSF